MVIKKEKQRGRVCLIFLRGGGYYLNNHKNLKKKNLSANDIQMNRATQGVKVGNAKEIHQDRKATENNDSKENRTSYKRTR